MGKFLSALGSSLFALLLIPTLVFAEDAGAAEEVAAEPSGLLVGFLTVLALATLVTMIYHCISDNG